MRRHFTAIAFWTLTFSAALTASAADDLPNFHEVNASILRSGRPTEKGLTDLRNQRGLKTIINLEDSSSNVKKEAGWARKLGIDYLSYPTASFSRPNDAKVAEILNILNDQTRYPILIHCQHGQDRTGLMIGLHRVFTDQWTPKTAYQEMLDLGFHTILFSLDQYFKDKTGLRKHFSLQRLEDELEAEF
jgi:protein tyrosine/serine phosphatase